MVKVTIELHWNSSLADRSVLFGSWRQQDLSQTNSSQTASLTIPQKDSNATLKKDQVHTISRIK